MHHPKDKITPTMVFVTPAVAGTRNNSIIDENGLTKIKIWKIFLIKFREPLM